MRENKSCKWVQKIYGAFRKITAVITMAMLILSMLPMDGYAMSNPPPAEKVVAQNGVWSFDSNTAETGQVKMWSWYTGVKEQEPTKPVEDATFEVHQKTKLSRLLFSYNRLPDSYFNNVADGTPKVAEVGAAKVPKEGETLVSIDPKAYERGIAPMKKEAAVTLKDSTGRKIGSWPISFEFASIAGSTPKEVSGVVVLEDQEIILKKGSYSLELSEPNKSMYNWETGFKPAFAVIGVSFDAWEKYQSELARLAQEEKQKKQQDEQNANGDGSKVPRFEEIGQRMVAPEKETAYTPLPQAIPQQAKSAGKLKPAEFTLDKESYITEIQTDHFNGGKGAAPGTIKLFGGPKTAQKTYGPWPATTGKLSGTDKGVWLVKPKVVLPAGSYTLTDSDMSTLSYDPKTLAPAFYVQATDPPSFDFTGTYFVNVKTVCVASLNPSKIGQPSKFDRDGFEVTVLDKSKYLEIIAKYTQEKKKDPFARDTSTQYDFKDVPVSQIVQTVDRKAMTANATFSLNLDLTNLPYKAKVGINVPLAFDASQGTPRITAKGSATYVRPFTQGYGGDSNAYSVAVSGQRISTQIPDYVRVQMIKVGNIGNVPGPENEAQGAVGTLFPPLAALAIQIALTMRKPKKISPPPEDDDSGSNSSDSSGSSGGETAEDGGSSSDSGDADGGNGSDGAGDEGSEGGRDDSETNGDSSHDSSGSEVPTADNAGGGSGHVDGGTTTEAGSDVPKDTPAQQTPVEPPVEPQKPTDGDELKVHDYGDGKDKTYIYNADTDKWVNPLTGAEYNAAAYERNKNTYADDLDRKAAYDEFIKKVKDEGPDKFLQEVIQKGKDRVAAMDTLQKMGDFTDNHTIPMDGPTSMADRIEALKNDLANGTKTVDEVRAATQKLSGFIKDTTLGKVGTQSDVNLADWGNSTLGIFSNGVVNTGKQIGDYVGEKVSDVALGRTWTGMGIRIASDILTGGYSELVYLPVSMGHTAVQALDHGDSATVAVLKAWGQETTNMLVGAGLFKGLGLGIRATGFEFKPSINLNLTPAQRELANSASTTLSTVATTVKKVANTDLGALLSGAESSAGRSTKQIAPEVLETLAKGDAANRAYNRQIDHNLTNLNEQVNNNTLTKDGVKNVLSDYGSKRALNTKGKDSLKSAFNDVYQEQINKPACDHAKTVLEADLGVNDPNSPHYGYEVEVKSMSTPGKKITNTTVGADNDIVGKLVKRDKFGNVIDSIEIDQVAPGKLAKAHQEGFSKACGVLDENGFNAAKAQKELGVDFNDVKQLTDKMSASEIKELGVDPNRLNNLTSEEMRTLQANKYSKMYGQDSPGKFGREGAVDFANQDQLTKMADGKLVRNQDINAVSQLDRGLSTLKDPEQLGKMDIDKIGTYLEKGTISGDREAFEQLGKMGNLANRVQSGYKNMGYEVGAMPENLQSAMEVVKHPSWSPARKTFELQRLGIDGPKELANKLSGQIESVKMAVKKTQPDGFNMESLSAALGNHDEQ